VFVRETVQNSWDARLRERPVTYHLDITSVSAAHRPAWQRLLAPPGEVDRYLAVGRLLRGGDLRVLSVIDRGTAGLGGPTRADELATDRRDWVSFVLNVGEKRDTEQGGGTYGYGKAVLYRLSKVGTILVYTRTVDRDAQLVSRLIGIALGESFETAEHNDARPYTGRHWWGRVQDEHVEPLLGEEADAVARSLGLVPFEQSETGTTLVVLDPDLDEFDEMGEDADGAARHLAETIGWHTWPLMLADRGVERLVPRVTVGGRDVPVPDPSSTYPLKLFVAAYQRMKSPDGQILACGNPVRDLGRFALHRRVVLPMTEDSGTAAAAYAGVPGDPHHICLMRSPELVVKYFEGPKPFSTNLAYAGVFRALDELDEVFAASEPPTHDNWVHEQLQGNDRRFVRVTFTRLKEQLAGFKRATTAPTVRTGVALGAASNFLGGLIAAAYADDEPALSATGAGGRGEGWIRGRPGGSGSGASAGGGQVSATASRARVSMVGEPRIDEVDGAPIVVQTVHVSGENEIELSARLVVVTADGREEDPPIGARRPVVHSWRTPDGPVMSEVCVVRPPVEIQLWVNPAPDTLTDVSVDARVVEAAS
jgi:hypothetical protein